MKINNGKVIKKILDHFDLKNDKYYVWGRKKSGERTRKNAKKYNKSINTIEDGFIRSIKLGRHELPYSVCIDKYGIFYDNSSDNELKNLIRRNFNRDQIDRGKDLIGLWRKNRISKYNYNKESQAPEEPFILLIDQTYRDLSIEYGCANISNFKNMLNWSLQKWPKHKILIKTHPETALGFKRGYFHKINISKERVILDKTGGHPCNLIEKCDAICVVTSQIGFEGLIWGKDVYVFGKPFYSQLGLTYDYINNKEINKLEGTMTIEKLVYSCLVDYCIYINPETNKRCEVEEIIKYIGMHRNYIEKWSKKYKIIRFTPWKKRQFKRFMPDISEEYKYKRQNKNVDYDQFIWGMGKSSNKEEDTNLYRVEDGFIRSVGLGANLNKPLSLVFDKKGMYYDASKYSELEIILKNINLTKEETKRSENLKKLIVENEISKYNIKGEKEKKKIYKKNDKNIVLVIGQVPNDASIKYGIPKNSKIKNNLDLVRNTRNYLKDSWLIYKPHPDIINNLRRSNKDDLLIKDYCDEISEEETIEELLEISDTVSVLTSLAGFEALIRGKKVRTWGIPFYAGWGLTDDYLKEHNWIKQKRNKILTLDELIYACLIKYPIYGSIKNNKLCTVEKAIDEIISLKKRGYIYESLEQKIFKWWGLLKDYTYRKI